MYEVPSYRNIFIYKGRNENEKKKREDSFEGNDRRHNETDSLMKGITRQQNEQKDCVPNGALASGGQD